MPFASINPTNPRTNPWNFHKKIWELAILKNALFLSRPFWIFPWKLVKVYWLGRMAQNCDQAKLGNTFWPTPNILGGSVPNCECNGVQTVHTIIFMRLSFYEVFKVLFRRKKASLFRYKDIFQIPIQSMKKVL